MKKLFSVIAGLLLACVVTNAQDSPVLTNEQETQLKLNIRQLFSSYSGKHSLAAMSKAKTLKSIAGQTVCFESFDYQQDALKLGEATIPEPALILARKALGYYAEPKNSLGNALLGAALGAATGTTVNLSSPAKKPTEQEEQDVKSKIGEMVFTVKKASSSKVVLIYEGKELKVPTSDGALDYLMPVDKHDELLNQIAQLKTSVEQEVLKQFQANLTAYHESVAKFRQGGTGPIAVNKEKRDYDGTIPFGTYNSNKYETFLDETFVFKKKALQKKIQERQIRSDKIKLIEAIQNDTLGLFNDNGHFSFISLRTGHKIDFYELRYDLLESTTYLDNYSKVPPFNYDGTWSLRNLLYGYCPNTKYPQVVYDALEGEKVYVLKVDDYEEDEIAEISTDRNNKLHIETKKNGMVEIDRIVGVRWLEKLQAMVGKKVIKRTEDGMFYKEDLPKMEVWTIDGIEAKKYNRMGEYRLELDMNLSNGEKKITIDVLNHCSLLTRSLDLTQPIKGNEWIVLSYDYLVANAPNMPEEVKKEREATAKFFNALGNAFLGEIKKYNPVKEMKKQAKQTHVYECQHCRARLRATGKGNFFQSGKCKTGFPHAWEKID